MRSTSARTTLRRTPVQYSILLMSPARCSPDEVGGRPQALAAADEEIGEVVLEGDVDRRTLGLVGAKNSSTVMFISSTVMSVEASRTTGSTSPTLRARRST